MATKKKLLQAAAGSAGGAEALNVEQLFSTYLYEGNGSSQTIQNGVNLGQSYGSGSARFGGTDTGEYLQTPVSTDFQLGNGDFTVEFFMNVTSDAGENQEPFSFGDGTGEFDFLVFLTGGNVKVYMSSNGSSWDLINGSNAGSYTIGKWHHVAVTRSSAGVRGFVDGVQGFGVGTSATLNQSANQISIGRGQTNKRFNGYISDFHFIKGTEKYSTNFTPPTSALTAQANTKLLTLQQDTLLTDNSTTGHTITEYGGSIYDEPVFGPFDAADAGEGGMVFFKNRNTTDDWHTYDTERGTSKRIALNQTTAQYTGSSTYGLTSFNSNGFSVGTTGAVNNNGSDLASWTFRKAPKFFDVVTYTGTGSARSISHNLNADVGMLIVKATSGSTAWRIWTNALSGTERLQFDTSAKATTNTSWDGKTPTSTEFYLGADTNTNNNGTTYVAYLFAHNDGDGDFGPTGDQDIIKCGVVSHTQSNGYDSEVNLGFEPQWLLIKNSNNAGYAWAIFDTMRGWTVQSEDNYLTAESSNAEGTTVTGTGWIDVTPTGFKIQDAMFGTGEYIYIAIRRGPMAVPTDATDVFAMDTLGGTSPTPPGWVSGFPVDMSIYKHKGNTSDWVNGARLMGGNYLIPSTTNSQATLAGMQFDFQNGYWDSSAVDSQYVSWMWKRAPNFFDVVAYTGNGTLGHTVSHNLGVAPEMMWIKVRSEAEAWRVYHSGLPTPEDDFLKLNTTEAAGTTIEQWNSTAPTATEFSVSGQGRSTNDNGERYIAYLFASVDGVSKVGSYTGTGATLNIDCGFSSGARFILIKRTDSSPYDWFVWDSERGIVAGNDPRLNLNTTNAEVTTQDDIDPYSSGFTISSTSPGINTSGGSYIFYAIA